MEKDVSTAMRETIAEMYKNKQRIGILKGYFHGKLMTVILEDDEILTKSEKRGFIGAFLAGKKS